MIGIPDLIDLVKVELPDAEVNVMDKTGMQDHFAEEARKRLSGLLSPENVIS